MTETKEKKAEKVTIRTVAKDAGVSVAAVSKVLRDAYGVSDELRAKVQESIVKLDYRPSTAARGMRGKTYSVGILLVEMANPFLPSLIDAIKARLGDDKYRSLIGVGDYDDSISRSVIDAMVDLRMDGVILVSPRIRGEELTRYARQIPMVVIGHHEPDATSFDTVNSADAHGAKIATEALIAKGYSKIHMSSLSPRIEGDFNVFTQRENGYLEAMREAGREDETHIWRFNENGENIGKPITDLLHSDEMPDALFCWSDLHGISILNQARTKGISVPEDLALIGYDNSTISDLPLVGLSSIDQQSDELGRIAAETLLSRIEGRKEAIHLTVEPQLVQRSSF